MWREEGEELAELEEEDLGGDAAAMEAEEAGKGCG